MREPPLTPSSEPKRDRVVAHVVDRHVMEERIVAQIETLGALPDVVADIIRLADHPDTNAGQIEKAVSRDPVIAGRLFKLANSSFFSRIGKVSTLGQAVRNLGFTTIKNLVLAASAGSMLGKRLGAYDYLDTGLWDHSIGVALTCRSIAKGLDLKGPIADEVFLSGLLHDIGKLVLDPFLRESYDGSFRITTDHEKAVVALDHTEVGARLAERWKLPEHAHEVISAHHDPGQAPEFPRHAGVVNLCDYFIAKERLGRRSGPDDDILVAPSTLDCLGIDEADIPDLSLRINEDLREVSMFQGIAA